MVGQKTSITEVEKRQLVAEFRDKLADILASTELGFGSDSRFASRFNESDALVCRYLKGANHNVDQAAERATKCLKIVDKLGIDKYKLTHFPPEVHLMNPIMVYKTDYEGNVCVYMRVKFHIPLLCPSVLMFAVRYVGLKLLDWEEEVKDKAICTILDFQGVGWSNLPALPTPSILKWGLRLDKAVPAMKVKIVAYNAPRVAAWFYTGIRPFIPARHRHKIHVVNGQEIEKIIPRENLPYFIVGGAGGDDENLEAHGPFAQQPSNDCVDFDEAAKLHGLNMDHYQRRVKPRIGSWIKEEFAAFPKQFEGCKSRFLDNDDDSCKVPIKSAT